MQVNARVSEINKQNFQERFKKINADRDVRTVWECVDRPIRPLVFELARIGMIPKFSCCGYSYEDEEEPKTHHSHHAYVHFYAPKNYMSSLHKLFNCCQKCGWEVKPFNDIIWDIKARNPVPDDMYRKEDGIEEAIHQYEGYGLKIEKLAWVIQENFITEKDPITIIDGNIFYTKLKNWIVRPKQHFTIKVEEYYKTYGKLDKNVWVTPVSEILGTEIISGKEYQNWLSNNLVSDEVNNR